MKKGCQKIPEKKFCRDVCVATFKRHLKTTIYSSVRCNW